MMKPPVPHCERRGCINYDGEKTITSESPHHPPGRTRRPLPRSRRRSPHRHGGAAPRSSGPARGAAPQPRAEQEERLRDHKRGASRRTGRAASRQGRPGRSATIRPSTKNGTATTGTRSSATSWSSTTKTGKTRSTTRSTKSTTARTSGSGGQRGEQCNVGVGQLRGHWEPRLHDTKRSATSRSSRTTTLGRSRSATFRPEQPPVLAEQLCDRAERPRERPGELEAQLHDY